MASSEKRMIPLEIEDTKERQEERIDGQDSLLGLLLSLKTARKPLS